MATLCPVCNRDDMIAKVSAIVSSQTHVVRGTVQHQEHYTDGLGNTRQISGQSPYSATQSSDLAQRLALPRRPAADQALLLAAIILGITSICSIIGIPFVFIPILLFINYNKQVKEASVELPRWERAREKWNRLYYCSRDDVVFNPEDGANIPIQQLRAYIYN